MTPRLFKNKSANQDKAVNEAKAYQSVLMKHEHMLNDIKQQAMTVNKAIGDFENMRENANIALTRSKKELSLALSETKQIVDCSLENKSIQINEQLLVRCNELAVHIKMLQNNLINIEVNISKLHNKKEKLKFEFNKVTQDYFLALNPVSVNNELMSNVSMFIAESAIGALNDPTHFSVANQNAHQGKASSQTQVPTSKKNVEPRKTKSGQATKKQKNSGLLAPVAEDINFDNLFYDASSLEVITANNSADLASGAKLIDYSFEPTPSIYGVTPSASGLIEPNDSVELTTTTTQEQAIEKNGDPAIENNNGLEPVPTPNLQVPEADPEIPANDIFGDTFFDGLPEDSYINHRLGF